VGVTERCVGVSCVCRLTCRSTSGRLNSRDLPALPPRTHKRLCILRLKTKGHGDREHEGRGDDRVGSHAYASVSRVSEAEGIAHGTHAVVSA